MDDPTRRPVCYCGLVTEIKTSWTTGNPGRRFFGCKNHASLRYKSCRFMQWYDPPMTPRATVVLNGLLRKLNGLEMGRKKERIIWVCLVIVMMLFLICK
ncbi:hypothetical protein GQ457_12G003780 [Hibiscus cannabinus]